MKLICSRKYKVDLRGHVFLTEKFFKTAQKLLEWNILRESDLFEPSLASREDLLLVHTPDWVDKILKGTLSPQDEALMELPYSRELASAHQRSVQGTIEAAKEALKTGLGLHAGGGSHHAFPDHGEGFCVFNDIAAAAAKMLKEKKIKRAAVVDLDVHQGNGTAFIFAGRPEVFTFSMHQENNYPPVKVPGSLDIGLEDRTGDERYLKALKSALPEILDSHKPELVLYQAGVDCYEKDQLGGLGLTRQGMRERDLAVFIECFKRGIPVAVTLGGGYAINPEETVDLHAGTFKAGIECRQRFWTQGAHV